MMKKTVIACALALLSLNATALPFDGLYLGGVVGGTKAIVHSEQMTNAILVVGGVPQLDLEQNNNHKTSDSSWIGGSELGLGKVFDQYYYLGIEAVAQFEDITRTNSFELSPTQTTPITYAHTGQAKLNNELALTFNPGIVVKKTTLIYGKIGPSWGRFSTKGNFVFTESLNPGETVSATKAFDEDYSYKVGLRLGLGIEHYIIEHLSLKLEYLNTNYGQINSGKMYTTPLLINGTADPLIAGSAIHNQSKLTFRNNTVMLGLNYHFGAW
jgi:opacity protein-like surface antigen